MIAGIADQIAPGILTGAGEIGIAIGKAIGKYKIGKRFIIAITDTSVNYRRYTAGIDAEA